MRTQLRPYRKHQSRYEYSCDSRPKGRDKHHLESKVRMDAREEALKEMKELGREEEEARYESQFASDENCYSEWDEDCVRYGDAYSASED